MHEEAQRRIHKKIFFSNIYFEVCGSVLNIVAIHRYEGHFVNGKRHGSGTCEYANGDIYEGEWRNNERSGSGLMLLANGDRFEGIFRGDKKNGSGKYYYRDTRKMYEGEWVNDIAKCGVSIRIACK